MTTKLFFTEFFDFFLNFFCALFDRTRNLIEAGPILSSAHYP